MDFEQEYSEAIALVTRFVAELPRRTYLAPGNSAREMVIRMKEYAKFESLSLPSIHVLSHEDSWLLYAGIDGSAEPARQLVRPYSEGRNPRRVFLLEDHYWDGDKIGGAVAKLAGDMSHPLIDAHFIVMVGSERLGNLPLPNTTVITENQNLAYVLYQTYNRRKF